MKRPVIAIGLDAADPELLEKWMSEGHLENFSRLRQQGAYGRLTNIDHYTSESTFVSLLTGCPPAKTGYWWNVKFKADTYDIENGEATPGFAEYPPFYALGDNYRVAVFDVPQSTIADHVNGVQVLAWGAHSPETPSHSKPAEVLPDIIRQYGEHPALRRSYADNWWDQSRLKSLQNDLETGLVRRSAICRDLLKQEKWDLFLTMFSESHPAEHHFWHLSQPDHPLYDHCQPNHPLGEPLLDVFKGIDQALGEILSEAPDDAYVMIFSVHGVANNADDLASMAFLPELLYRYSFPGQIALTSGQVGTTPPPPIVNPKRKKWAGEIWDRKHEPNLIKKFLRQWTPGKYQYQLEKLFGSTQQPDITSPYRLAKESPMFCWQPTMWYKPLWPQMKAFALPSFGSGYVRINLQGREPQGIVAPSDYDAVCDELTQHLHSLKNARTGQPVVERVVKTRQSATDRNPKLPDGDLVIVWADQPADVVDSPELGRIGPFPYCRTSGHKPRGFVMLQGPGIEPGSALPTGHAIDVAPTILELMGAPVPDYCEGKPLVHTEVPV